MKRSVLCLLMLVVGCQIDPSSQNELENPKVPDESVSLMELDPAAFVKWVKDPENGLNKKRQIMDVSYELQFKPVDFVAIMELKKRRIMQDELIRKREEIGKALYFNFKIAIPNGEGELLKYKLGSYEEYTERVKYLSFSMQNDLALIQDTVSVPCIIYHFERIYDVGPYCSMVVGFDPAKVDLSKEITFVYYDRLFNTGNLRFLFPGKSFTIQPKLIAV